MARERIKADLAVIGAGAAGPAGPKPVAPAAAHIEEEDEGEGLAGAAERSEEHVGSLACRVF